MCGGCVYKYTHPHMPWAYKGHVILDVWILIIQTPIRVSLKRWLIKVIANFNRYWWLVQKYSLFKHYICLIIIQNVDQHNIINEQNN